MIKKMLMSPFGRLDGDFLQLMSGAADGLLEGDSVDDIAAIYLSTFAPFELCGISDPAGALRTHLAQRYPKLGIPVNGPYLTGGAAMVAALEAQSARNGPGGDAVIIGCEKMTHSNAATAAGLLAPRVNPYEHRQGATLPALAALVSQAYARRWNVPYEAFHHVSVKNHRNGSLNPKAHFRKCVTYGDVAGSPMVADPLRRHHCAPMSDGAVACRLSCNGPGPGVRFRAWAGESDARYFHLRSDIARFPAAARSARRAFSQARVRPGDVDVVEIHDAFSPFELINLEEMGFFPPGRAWRSLVDGDLSIGGRMAVNPSGGLKARGHPIGACGLSSLAEASNGAVKCAARMVRSCMGWLLS